MTTTPDPALLVQQGEQGLSTELADLAADAVHLVDASRSAGTRRVYASAWAAWEAWCVRHAVSSLPASPEAVLLYIAALRRAGRSTSTVGVAMAAIAGRHREAGLPEPGRDERVRRALMGVRRLGRDRPRKAATPVLRNDLRAMVAASMAAADADRLRGIRDRALVQLGWVSALRRSELVALIVDDVDRTLPGRTVLHVRHSKGDQGGHGAVIPLPHDVPVVVDALTALDAWLDAAGIVTGPLWRPVNRWGAVGKRGLGPAAVADTVARLADAAGLCSCRTDGARAAGMKCRCKWSGHSLRAGLATQLGALGGATERQVELLLRHRTPGMGRLYVRDSDDAAMAVLRSGLCA